MRTEVKSRKGLFRHFVNVPMDLDLVEWLDKECAKHDRFRAAQVRYILRTLKDKQDYGEGD